MLDRGDSADLLDVLRHEQGLSVKDKRFPRKDTCLAIYSHRINTQGSLEATLQEQFPWCLDWHDELKALYREYTARKQAHHLLDFDDLLLYWHILMSEASLARAVGGQFDHVLVDEYQDTNALQSGILMRLKPDGAGLTVVGDDAQAIYSFRAATVENILQFPQRFSPGAAVIALEDNYRSSQPVLDAANALMEEGTRRYHKVLRATRGSGERPRFVTVEDLREQAEYVAQRVLDNREGGVALRRQAVLFRSSSHSDLLEIELSRRNIPFVKYGGLKFLEAAHVKDLLAVLRWADNPRNGIAGFRVLQLIAGMGPASARRCLDFIAGAHYSLRALARFDAPPGAADHWAALAELLPRLADPSTPWTGQVRSAREWYQPLLERLYEAAHVRVGDLERTRAVVGAISFARAFPHRARAGSAERVGRPGRAAAARRGLPDPLDGAFRQGPGMGCGVRAQRDGRQLPVRIRRRQAGADRGRAPPSLRGDDARPLTARSPLPLALSRHAAAQAR